MAKEFIVYATGREVADKIAAIDAAEGYPTKFAESYSRPLKRRDGKWLLVVNDRLQRVGEKGHFIIEDEPKESQRGELSNDLVEGPISRR